MSRHVFRERAFNIPLDSSKNIRVSLTEPNISADQLSLTTWTSSFVLASQLHKLALTRPSKSKTAENTIPILELGAGTGLVGITASILLNTNAVLTDLPDIIPGIQANVDLNMDNIIKAAASVVCGTLDWNNPKSLSIDRLVATNATSPYTSSETTQPQQAHLILAADTVYDVDHPVLISQTILAWLARTPDSRAVLTYALRVAYLDQIRELWELLEAGGLVAVTEGQGRPEDFGGEASEWDDERLCEWCVWAWKDLQE